MSVFRINKMKLQKPYNQDFRISQHFGQNLVPYYKADGNKGHGGLDIAMPTGTPIFSACDGEVIFTSEDVARGVAVSVLSSDIFQHKGKPCRLTVLFAHLKEKSLKVKVGDKVKVGQLLALSNNTGRSTGPHLHIGVCPIAVDARRELDLGNGYKGMVDPEIYFDLETAQVKRIRQLQTFLNENGATLTVDGKWGKLSKKALDKFLE